MSEIERVEEIRSFLKFNKKTFTEILGNSTPQSYTNFLNGTSNLSMRMINGLIKHDPRLNINWILTGQGQMLLNNDISNQQKIINGDGNKTQIGHFNNSNNSNNKNISVNSNNNELELLKNKIEHLKTALEDKDERLKDKDERLRDKDERLKDKDELIALLKKNQK